MKQNSSRLRVAAFLSLTIAVLAGGCRHPRPTPESAAASPDAVSRSMVGKQITIHGKFSLFGKFGPFVELDNHQAVYLVPTGSFTWGKPYSDMEGKAVAATGTLRFFHPPNSKPDPARAHPLDYFYFEAETAQLRLIDH